MQFAFVVLRQIFFVLHLIFVHLFVLVGPVSLLFKLSIVNPGGRGRRVRALGELKSKMPNFLKGWGKFLGESVLFEKELGDGGP